MFDTSLAPRPVLDLANWLERRGSPLTAVRFDSPGNQVLESQVALGTVQVLADRSQWFVALAPRGSKDYFDTAVWASCALGKPVGLEVEPLTEQVAWLKSFLANETTDISIESLRSARHVRAYGRVGLEP